MKKSTFLTVSIMLIVISVTAQMKVTNYSFGKRGKDNYEHFEFWTKDGKRTEITYSYGRDSKEVKLQYTGNDNINDSACFKVRFSNNYMLYIIPMGKQLHVTDAHGTYNKTFSWEYEGSVNGIGTYCDICAKDPDDGMHLIQTSYMK
jgi:hypothetical protein